MGRNEKAPGKGVVSQGGLTISRRFTDGRKAPYDYFRFEERTSVIRNPKGEVVFEQTVVEVPVQWSQVATDILAQKYFRRSGVPQQDGAEGGEHSVRQVVHRLAECWRWWGKQYGYFATEADEAAFYDEVVFMLLAQYAAPNSPQWFNTGLFQSYGIKGPAQGHFYVDNASGELKKSSSAYEHPQPHACFILSVKDDLVNPGGIMDLWVREARIFKFGSGAGANFSALRGDQEKLSGGGYSSGLMSFLKIGDQAAGAIKSGGTTRRAAKMVCLDVDHPEVEDFIRWKAREEKKAEALMAAGYSAGFEGEAYQTVSGQHANNSVRIPNRFFEVLDARGEWELLARSNGAVVKKLPAAYLWEQIAEAAWSCADPGLQFDTTINEWHTCPQGGRIRASNPCSEYMFLDDTACNLASLNLRKFYNESSGQFEVENFAHACRIWTVVLELSVLMAQFPSAEVARNSFDYRTLGLGYANLGAILMVQGLAYDSNEGRSIAAALTSMMTGVAYATSAEMAGVMGPFNRFAENRDDMLRVIRNHRSAAYNTMDGYEGLSRQPAGIVPADCPVELLNASCKVWDEALALGERFGFRNAQVTVLAPTGTIGLLMDCDTTGVEPDFALVKYKKLSGGGYFKIVNQALPTALKTLNYSDSEVEDILRYVIGVPSFFNAPFVHHTALLAKGFTAEDLQKLEHRAADVLDVRFLFTAFTLGTATYQRLGVPEQLMYSPEFDLLSWLGFTEQQIEAANRYICGTMTVEGAPHLKEADLPVFDCANRCGKYGARYIAPEGHLLMMAAVQPFLSGAISKTVNLPNSATVGEIRDCFMSAWKLGLKAIAVYRDGCKHAQPLSSTAASDGRKPPGRSPADLLTAIKETMLSSADIDFQQELSALIRRKRLSGKRAGFTQEGTVGGHPVSIRTGEYDDGTLGELFADVPLEGPAFRSLLQCFAISVSIGLQYGVPLEEYVEKFVFTSFEPSGPVDHPNIKTATSLVDYIFRLLALEYLKRDDLVQVKPDRSGRLLTAQEEAADEKSDKVPEPLQDYLEHFMGDAPLCSNCGHITIRSGSCYKCLNCGTSMGCS